MKNLDLAILQIIKNGKLETLAEMISRKFCFNPETYESWEWDDDERECTNCPFRHSDNCDREEYAWLIQEVNEE